jgi:hypothetical protein
MMNAAVWQSSNDRVVHWFPSRRLIHSMYSLGIPLLRMLCMSRSISTLGKAPLMSRNSVDATCIFHHVSLTVFISMCIESVIVRPGLAPK